MYIPFLDISSSELIKPICADGRDPAEDGQSTRPAKWQIALIFDGFETARWRHVSASTKKVVSQGAKLTQASRTVCKASTLF